MIKAILLDIEGTTTPIDFVHKTLFPYSFDRMAEFVTENFGSLAVEIDQLASEASEDADHKAVLDPTDPGSVATYLQHLISIDRKSTPLKSIQGKIWELGYRSGELKSVVYDDVRPAFERWTSASRSILIYSSGSVLAQKLLFGYTNAGDLMPFISGYFDTNIGPKRDTASYAAIAHAVGIDASSIEFVSDIPAELDAAERAGMMTVLSVRPGNAPVAGDVQHRRITTFDQID